MKTIAICSLVALILSGCAQSGYKQFYQNRSDPATLAGLALLKDGETPSIWRTEDLRGEVKKGLSKGYKIIGQSSFNGAMEGNNGVIAQAKAVRATHVVLASQFAETRTITTPLVMPTTSTTYNSGTVSSGYRAANYSGTSTTYGSTVVPMTTQQNRYEQTAVFMAKSITKPKLGVILDELDARTRTEIQRNTGALISIVIEDTPAFNADILEGDVIIAINDFSVLSPTRAIELMDNAPDGKPMKITVLRNGQYKDFSVTPRF
jgi:serine protease Do